ncbi:MAG: zinc finger AN1 domain-containing stress-associated protein [Candidatus Lokiarchaeota archaeon]
MNRCYYCGVNISQIPYRCSYCGMYFCSDHRLPENHKCNFELKYIKSPLRYEDALDFNAKDLTVADIYHLVTNNKMERSKAIEILGYFIEKENDFNVKFNSISAFKVLDLKSPEVFKILENCILSENNPELKKVAVSIIKHLFPRKSQNIVDWFKRNKIK